MFDVFPGYNATPMTDLAMQLPILGYGSPIVPDWNNDGVLDLFHHNHYIFDEYPNRWSDPSMARYGPVSKKRGCFIDWDAVLRNGDTGAWYAANNGDGFLEWADEVQSKCLDVHSTGFFDIDGDGLKDLYLVTGGGRGGGRSKVFDNAVFWGVKANTPLGFKLSGGQEAAKEAGLEGRDDERYNERGRHQYWLDVDGDGRLDVITLNQERTDDIVVPGGLKHNTGGRKFVRAADEFKQFSGVALLTDVDGDGFARELIVTSECNKNSPNDVCRKSPIGTVSVYRIDPLHLLKLESQTKKRQDFAKTIANGDFDNDGIVDTAIMYSKRVDFHLSTTRKARCDSIVDDDEWHTCKNTLGEADYSFSTRSICGNADAAAGMRLADFNNDGVLDMLLICRKAGLHAIFEHKPNGTWERLTNNLGALSSQTLMNGPPGLCDDVPISSEKMTLNTECKHKFPKTVCQEANLRYKKQFVICNRYASTGDESTALAIGATVADVDNDGFVDVLIGHKFGSSIMLRNTFGDTSNNKFIAIRLDRTAGPAESIGAVLKLTAKNMGASRSTTTQLRVLNSLVHTADPDGGNEDRVIFGLGSQGVPTQLEIQWPHCCYPTIINESALSPFVNSMKAPYEVPAPTGCFKGCFIDEWPEPQSQ